jgi:hypothetical protein
MADATTTDTSTTSPGATPATTTATPATTTTTVANTTAAATTTDTTTSQAPTIVNQPIVDKAQTVPADFPTDWREKMAGSDTALLHIMQRYASPVAFANAHRELHAERSSGKLRAPAPAADAPPEQLAQWRKDNGIPDAPEGYLLKLPSGLVVSDDDKEMLGSFLKTVHGQNASPETVGSMVDWYYKNFETIQAKQQQNDVQAMQATEEALRAEWSGSAYRANLNAISGYLDTAPQGVKDIIFNARGVDGVPIMSKPDVVRFLHSAAMEANPASTIAPGNPGTAGATIDDQLKQLDIDLRTDSRTYFKNGGSEKRIQLLAAKEQLAAKGR